MNKQSKLFYAISAEATRLLDSDKLKKINDDFSMTEPRNRPSVPSGKSKKTWRLFSNAD